MGGPFEDGYVGLEGRAGGIYLCVVPVLELSGRFLNIRRVMYTGVMMAPVVDRCLPGVDRES